MNTATPNQPSTTPKNTLAIISLITGILSFFLLPGLGAIAAIITGVIAKKQIRQSGEASSGNGMATAGIILGIANLVLILIPICVIVVLSLLGPAIGDVFSNITQTI